MSKICPYCKAEMPEEANLCLKCMNYNNIVSTTIELPRKNDFMHLLKKRIEAFYVKFKSFPLKKKIKIYSTAICCFLLIVSLIYLLSPAKQTDTTNLNSSQGNYNSDEDSANAPITHAETLINKIFGKEENSEQNARGKNGSSPSQISENTSADIADNNSSVVSNSSSNENKNPSQSSNSGQSSSSSSTENSSNDSENPSDDNYTPVIDYNDWEYTVSNDEITITRYIGNDKHVLIPDQIKSKNVSKISSNTFLNNSSLETVTFKDSEKYHAMWIDVSVFKNCSSLKKISFPNNTDLGFFYQFAVDCPKLSDIYINHWQGKFEDGAFYWKSNGRTWELIMYCEGCTQDTLDVPDWVSSVHLASKNISNCKYLKVLNLPKNCQPPYSQSSTYSYKYLEEINIDGDNGTQYYFTYNGVLFSRSGTGNYKLNLNIYPGAKKDTSFTFPEYCRIDFNVTGSDIKLETVYIPKSSNFDDSTLKSIKSYLKNLKTVKLEKGHSNISKYKSYLAWDCSVAEY